MTISEKPHKILTLVNIQMIMKTNVCMERQSVEEATESEGVTSMREFLRSRGAG